MTQIEQGISTVAVAGGGTLIYWVCSMFRHGDCNQKQLAVFAFNLVGVVTGVFIFLGSFDVMKTSIQNGIWSGVAGVVITLATAQALIKDFRGLFLREVKPIEESEQTNRAGQ